MKKSTKIIWGIALIAIGVILAGNAAGLFNIDLFFKGWWTLFIIIPSVVGLFTEGKYEIVSNLAGIAIGVLLLLACNETIAWDIVWKMIIPIILISIGLSMMIGKKK